LDFLLQINEENSDYVIKRFNSLKSADWDEKKTKVFLIGDSYAQDLTNAIYEADLTKYYSISTWHISARCGNLYVPVEEKQEFIAGADLPRCINADYFGNTEFIEKLKLANEVWFASSWETWQIELITNSLRNIEELTDAHIRVFGRKDFPSWNPRKYLGLSVEERASFSEAIGKERVANNQIFSTLLESYDFVDVQSLMCGGSGNDCRIFNEAGQLKTHDGGHLTKAGALFYGNGLLEIIGEPLSD
jgi:hypothetical protein